MPNHQVLARKWRPRAFKDMVGQEPILRMLANALEQKRLHHAYLFTGTRGTGKTTLARILAKCLNCEAGISPAPCDTCTTCQAIDNGQFLDLFEVDAASRTKVEDTRELLDNVLYPPTQGRYKIYLIDEVHMLSNHSFNALLKTLEEPPDYVIFLLATTEPKRLPITILSRCLQFYLKRITPEQIAKHLQHVCIQEQVAYEVPALEALAKAADGSMRDALSLLDQAIAYGHGTVNKQEVSTMLGSMAQDELFPLLTAIAAQNGQQLFTAIAQLAERAPDFQQVLNELISVFHHIAVAQIVPTACTEATIAAFAKQFSAADIQLYYQIALLGRRDLALSPTPQQGFEMTMLRLLAFKPELNTTQHTPAPISTPVQPEPVSAPPAQTSAATEWRDILAQLGLSGMAQALAANCTVAKIAGNQITLALAAQHQPMLNAKLRERITEALSRYFKQPMQVEITLSTTELLTPAKQQQNENNQKITSMRQSILEDPKIKQLIDMYDATIEVSLV